MQRRDFLKTASALVGLGLAGESFAGAPSPYEIGIVTGKIEPPLTGKNVRLREAAAKQFELMVAAAKKDGIRLYSTSSYRNYDRQLKIWNKKYDEYTLQGISGAALVHKIIEYSSLPGASRHHWGTDCDLTDLNIWQPENTLDACHYEECGVYALLGKWLIENTGRFGFVEAYNSDLNRTGFHDEPWHYSFADLSKPLYRKFINIVKLKDLKNPALKGNEYVTEDFLDQYYHEYVKGINPVLK